MLGSDLLLDSAEKTAAAGKAFIHGPLGYMPE